MRKTIGGVEGLNHKMGSFRGAKPLSPNHLPLSFEGVGDTGGEDDKNLEKG